jgi:predicted permease
MKIPLIRGRFFTDQDTNDSERVVIVDQNMARVYWPNTDPVGKRLKFGGASSNDPWRTIVGVAGSVKHYGLDTDSRILIYGPHMQSLTGGISLVVRTTADPLSLASSVTREVRALEPNAPIWDVKTMDQRLSESLARRRFSMIALSLFAGLAALLASVGIYGVMSYAVAERTREIGIRMAMGAGSRDVLSLVIGHGMKLAGVGMAIGLAGAFALTRVMASLLFGVSATDLLTFAVIALSLSVVALSACWIPARRAAKVDPMIALRCE